MQSIDDELGIYPLSPDGEGIDSNGNYFPPFLGALLSGVLR